MKLLGLLGQMRASIRTAIISTWGTLVYSLIRMSQRIVPATLVFTRGVVYMYHTSNAPVICKPSLNGAWDRGDIAALKCHVWASASSPQCCGIAGRLIQCPNWPLSHSFAIPTKWRVLPAKTRISLGVNPVWSVEEVLGPWIPKECQAKTLIRLVLSLCCAHNLLSRFCCALAHLLSGI